MRSLCLVLLLAGSAFAAPMRSGPRLYPEVSGPWRAALGERANGAVVHYLQVLDIAPENILANQVGEQTLNTAIDEARSEAFIQLAPAVQELIVEANRAAASRERLGQLELDRLYDLASRVREVHKEYGDLIDGKQYKAVALAAEAISRRWGEARAEYLKRLGETGARALENDTRDAGIAASRPKTIILNAKPSGVAMRDKMIKRKGIDFDEADLDTLLTGYEFTPHESGHRIYRRDDVPGAYVVVPKHGQVKPYIVRQALAAVEAVEAAALPPSAIQYADAPLPPRVGDSLRISRPAPPRVIKNLKMPVDRSLAASPAP